MSLAWGDTSTDSTHFRPVSTGGSGLTIGGSSDPTSPVTTPGTGYVDYLDQSGQPVLLDRQLVLYSGMAGFNCHRPGKFEADRR